MSWAEIKKAINSNISKSLDVLITEKCNEILTKLNSVYNTVTVKGNIPSVKSVQRGKVNYVDSASAKDDGFSISKPRVDYTTYYDITINSVNMDKSIVFIDGNAIYFNAAHNNYSFTLLNSNTIRVYWLQYTNIMTMNSFTWQVIEFY